MAEAEAMLTIAPAPCFSITGSTCLQPRNTLFRLRSTCASQASSVISTGPPAAEPPTLFTRMSTRPNLSRQALTMAAIALPSVTSQIWVAMPFALSTVSFKLPASRSTAKTLAPSSAKRTTVARPLPHPGPTEPAPATMATLSLSREPIEALGVVDEQCAALYLARRHVGDEVDEVAVVGDFLQIRMRPVGAPHGAVTGFLDQ